MVAYMRLRTGRALTLTGVLVFSIATMAGTATAHTLDKSDAARTARLELSEYADYRCSLRSRCDYAAYPELTKYDCTRDGAHSVTCAGAVDLTLNYEYAPNEETCLAQVTVRLQGYRRTARVSRWMCI